MKKIRKTDNKTMNKALKPLSIKFKAFPKHSTKYLQKFNQRWKFFNPSEFFFIYIYNTFSYLIQTLNAQQKELTKWKNNSRHVNRTQQGYRFNFYE